MGLNYQSQTVKIGDRSRFFLGKMFNSFNSQTIFFFETVTSYFNSMVKKKYQLCIEEVEVVFHFDFAIHLRNGASDTKKRVKAT